MELKINIEDYLDKEIVKEIFESIVKETIRENYKDYIEEVVFNLSYRYVWKVFDKLHNSDLEETVKSKIKEITDQFNPTNSIAQDMLEQSIKDNKPLIDVKIKEIIENYNYAAVRENIEDTVYECIMDNLFIKKED